MCWCTHCMWASRTIFIVDIYSKSLICTVAWDGEITLQAETTQSNLCNQWENLIVAWLLRIFVKSLKTLILSVINVYRSKKVMYKIQYLFNILSYKILETYRIKVSYFLVKKIKSSLCSLNSVCLLLIKYVWLSFQHFILCTFNVVKYLQESLQCEVFASVSASDVSSFFSSQGQFPLLIDQSVNQ